MRKIGELQEEQDLSISLERKREALEELSMLKEQHERICEEQARLEASLERKSCLEGLDSETDWMLH